MYIANKGDMHKYSDDKYQQHCFVAALLIPAVFFVLVSFSEEPLSLLDGTSMWPAELLKMLALWLSYFLFYHGSNMVVMGRQHIIDELNLGKKNGGSNDGIQTIWAGYQRDAGFSARRKRVWPVIGAWFIICGGVYFMQTPNIPYRGDFMFHVDWMLTYLTFFGFVVLFAHVSEATMHCRRFIQQLIDTDTIWPFMSKLDDSDEKKHIQHVQREWCEIKLIGMLTDSVSRTVYYPIYIILLLLAAQSDFFDNFDMPASLMLIASLNIFLVLMFSIGLRRKAIQARDVSLDKIREIEEEIFLDDDNYGCKEKKITLGKLHFYEKKIQGFREGAFLPITEQPWLRALTLMTGGGSSLLLLQYLAG